ncbi:hypothetical protein [Deinococcus cellulosilyticus]|uniref:Uncharacterized protein n=1 Tax=Deinococcus cellulosilyticus (strain DSM 18568 / NBRC 106333 / KACC 11606 / 5516J-15) TaxID=1223518 RepID=A0A511N8X7_DEIC1|nr:hypothetical protein [Deinococcus cellulosilyticus]GEM49262.1 hypothetical protein DC3_48970 [Deinococcus cellulosilyticus NBRC 106333 = KACC 11606]
MGVALQKPASRSHMNRNAFWALFSIALVILIAMAGLPVINTYLATPRDLNGTWTCHASCPKSTSFMLRGGGVYREIDGKVQQIGYWKWNSSTGLVLKTRPSTQKAFKWVFFNSALEPRVHFRWWTGEPQFCVDQKQVWCFSRTSGS